MKDFTFLMKNTNLESAVWNDGRTTVNRQSTDGQSQRQYTVGTIARPLPDSVSNPCRVRVLDYPQGISGLFSGLFSGISFARAWKHVAMIFAVLTLSIANIGMAWGVENTINSYNNDSVKSSLWFSIAASPVVSSITGSGSGSAAKAAKNSSGTQITVQSIASGSNVYTMTFGLKSGITVTGVALTLGDEKHSAVDIKIGSSTFTGSKKDWSLSGLSFTSSFSITVNGNEATGTSNRNTKIKSITFTYTTSGGCTPITPTWSTDYSSTTLNVGATSSAPVVGKDGSSGAVTFSSSDTYIATVNSSGVVTGVGAGTATITATVAAVGGKCAGTVTKEFIIKAGVTYDANSATGGSVPTDASTYAYNANITVAGNTGSLYKTGKVFNGWNTASDGTGTHYEAGATMKMPSKSTGVTLYAEWVGYATSWEWWNSGQSNNSTTFTYVTGKNYICSFASSGSTAVASWDMSGGEYYRGIKIKTKGHSIAFWVQTGKRVSITFGTRPTKPTFTVGGVDKSSDVGASNNADSITVTYTTTGDTKFYIENETATNTAFTVKSVKIEDAAPSCTAPNHVDISGDWDKFGGETISLTATAYSSAGTGSPIADGNITGWQWQKLVGTTWTDVSNGTADGVTTSGATTKNLQISNCGQGNSGKYRCVVSTGATCSTASATATDGSEGHGVKVYVLECYNSGTTVYNFTRDGNNQRGSLTIDLAASTNYGFKVHADDYYGNNGTVYEDVTNWVCSTDQAGNLTIAGGLGGTFTITMDYSASVGVAGEGIPEVTVTYPRKRIYLEPNSDWLSNSAKFAYYYYRKVGETTYGTGWTDFLTANDCGMSAEIPQWSGVQMIAVRFNSTKASTGNWDDKWNQTSDITVTSNDLITITGWDNSQTYTTYSIPTYTISYAGNGNTSGSMSNVSSIPCGEDRTLVTNTFVKTDNIFEGWKANVDVTIGGANVTAGTLISDGATIQNIHSDITLTAQWTACSGPSITAEAGMAGQTYTVGDVANTMTITASAGNGGTLHYHWYQYNVGQNPLTQSVDAVGGTDANTYTPSTASAHEGQIFYCVVSEEGCSTTVTSAYSGAITVNAVLTLYTVTYNVNGAGSVDPTSATQASEGASLTLPTPTWSGYTFEGWYNAGTKIGNAGASYTPTEDITLYAHWTDNIDGKVFSFIDNNYGDKFKAFDESGWVTGNATGKSKTYTNGTTGVQFVTTSGAWDKKDNAISALAKLVKGTTNMSVVIPAGKIATVKISYNAYGTGDDYRLTVNGSAQANPSTKLADGNTNAQVISNMKEITLSSQTGTLTLSVSGSKNDYIGRVSAVITGYTVSYDKGTYGSGTLAADTKTAGSPLTLSSSSSAFTRDGYTYDGWSINADGSTKDYNLGGTYSTDAAITFYPHWVAAAVTYSITYDCDGADSGCPSNVASAVTLPNPLPDAPVKAGYEFDGWYTNAGKTIAAVAGAVLSDNVTLYAKWVVDCKVSLSKVVLSSASEGTVTGYNAKEFAGDAVIGGLKGTETAEVDASNDGVETGYKLNSSGSAIVFATLKESFHEGDVVKVTITKENDNYTFPSPVSAKTGMDIYYGTDKDDATRLTTLSGVAGPGTYSYTLTAADITTIGSKKGIGVFRHSDRAQNHYVYSVEIVGCREHATVYAFSNGSFNDWGTCNGGTLTLSGSQSGVNYQLYKDGVASGDAKAGTGSALNWTVTASGTYTVKSVGNATYAETAMTGTANVTLQNPTLSGENTVAVGSTITLTHPGYVIAGDNWTSSNTSVATVTNAGVVTGVAAGTATITFHGVGACDGSKEITVVATYSITYDCDGAESGCPSNVAAATNLPNPLPSAPTKDGYDFVGWYTNSTKTVAAVAGAALSENTTLYAKWTEHIASECITITNFETSQHNNSSNKPDSQGKYIYGYKTTVDAEHAVTITTSNTNNKGQNSNADMLIHYGSSIYIYADNTTTGGTPATFSNVVSISLKIKNKHATDKSNFTIKVGSTTVANAVSLVDANNTTYTTYTYNNLAQLSGKIEIHNGGSGSTNFNFYVDDIEICTADMAACTTPTLPTATLNDQALCEGADIATWTATPTNASTITGKGESISYSWKKKGSETVLGTGATFDLGNSATESQAGTYVVTVTVSKAGYTSATVSEEIELGVTESTEVTSITADKATVYEGNSVTLTATANTTVTWQWYTCTNAAGDGESSIGGATSAAYAIASAPAAGTYYYKAVATGSCGTAERVYTLTVTAASECEKYFWFVYAADATSNGVINNRDNFFGSSPKTGSSNSSSYKFTLDGTEYTATRNTGDNTFSISFTVPEGSTATLALNCKGSSSKPIYLIPTSGDPVLITDNSSNAAHVVENIAAGTYKVGAKTDASASWTLAGMAVQVCTASSCTDATPTITAANTTVCVGSELSVSSTGYETGATFQWQKLNSSTSTWDNISGATSATYTVATAAAEHAGSYRLVATKGCARTSNTVTIAVPTLPNFGSTVPASVSVMQTIALSINTVEATDAVKYRWYKSADATWDAGDVEIGTNKELIKAYDSEAIGSPSYYIFCRAQNACGITTSSAIAVNVTTYIEEDCATKGNEGEAQFGFENTSCSQGTYSSESAWYTNSRTKYLTYTAPEGKYFDEAKVRIAVSSGSKCGYAYSTDGGANWTYAEKTGLSSDLADVTIDLTGNVNAFRIGRNLQDGSSKDWGVTSGNFYLTKACFTYINACTATTVTPSTSSVNYEIGGAWSNPTFSLSPAAVSGGTLTYSSSNEDIASVDDEGAVTFNGDAGTVTITASYAGGTVAAVDYCASEGYYTITVSCPGGAPKVVPAAETNMSGCNSSITLNAKKSSDESDFSGGSYQWFRNGTEIDGATSSSYTTTQAGTYTVERTNAGGCTTPSTNSVVITSETTEPEVERLVPFQYYHVDKTYTDFMKMRHLFAVKNSGKLDGKSFKLYVSRNGGAATDVTNSNALAIWTNADGRVDTVMVDLNKLSGKYSKGDELVYTCKAIDCGGNISNTYKDEITMHVIDTDTATLALICSGANGDGTRKTSNLVVGGDFLTGYNKADLCVQTGNTSFDKTQEWVLYTRLKENYIVTPVNGYAPFNKLNYEPFDILFLTDYPKASKSAAAETILDDMAALCDYRPLFSFKTHMVHKSPSKWAAKGFTTSPTENKGDGRMNVNIVCYAHPMFDAIKEGEHVYRDADDPSQLVYTMLTGAGHEGGKGMQGFEIDAAENFVTIGLTHYNATIAPDSPEEGEAEWTGGTDKDGKPNDRMLVTVAERQANLEARMILFSVNCGAQSKLTEKGRLVVLKCLEYLLDDDPLHVADCSFTFDNGANAPHDANWYKNPVNCPGCSGELGDGLWSTEANWGPDRINIPGEFTSARIAAPVTVDMEHAHALELRIVEGGHITIPSGKALDVKSTIRRMDGSEISPTENSDIYLGSNSSGNGTLIFNNDKGDSKATVAMYTTAKADIEHMSAATSTWQYIGTPHNDVAIATYNYYDSWLYQYDTGSEGWIVIPNGGPLVPFRGYCVTHPETNHTFVMDGTLAATGTVDIDIPAGKYVVVANSWTAPIDINKLADDDLENITDKSIYFFNTGSDSEGNGVTGTAAGTYRTTPIHAAVYTGDWQIPSMQGFYVVGGSSDGTLHLDYNRHVRPADARTIVNNPMYAPSRAKVADEEPTVLKIFARGNRYQDKLVVLEREDFTRGYDSGWDGEAWGGSDLSPMMYVIGEGRMDAVSAIPDMDGTVIGFRAGEDDIYTFHFEYDGYDEPLYLLDTDTKIFTRVLTGNIYTFMCTDKGENNRFLLTRKNAQDAPTDNADIRDEYSKPLKFLNNDKIYIYVRGVLYDITGKVVK